MDLERVSEFIVIAEEGSIKKAAEKLGVAPNVLSTRLQSFENSIGAVLINRNAHKFELTRSGEIFLQKAPQMLDAYDLLRTSMDHIKGRTFKSLRIMLCGQMLPMEFGPFLDRYCRQYPSMFLGLYDENRCMIREGLQSGEIDIAFAVGREGDFADISGRVLLHRFPKLKVHVPLDHRLAKRQKISFKDLSGETFILFPVMQETCIRDLQKSLLDQSGIEYRIYEDDGSPIFYDLLVPVGKGIRMWNWSGRLAPNSVMLTIDDQGYETCAYLLYNKDAASEAAEHFISRFLEFREERA